jgi:tungstate transport system substrate-binding protein
MAMTPLGGPTRRPPRSRRSALATLGAALTSAVVGLAAATLPTSAAAQDRFITMASTTSTEQSGLFKHLLPAFKQATGIDVRVVAVGTGQALAIGRRGDADLLFVHDTAAELRFVAEGHAPRRDDVMYNDFVLVGPASDPAGTKGRDIGAALTKIAAAGAAFVSRGDNSGTHAAERRHWKAAGIDVSGQPAWYKECGCGMGPALNIASSSGAYLLTDRGTWISFRNKGDLAILVEGDKRLFNQYGVMVIDPAKHPGVKADLAQRFADWVLSKPGQDAIAAYRIDGQQLFFPNAGA